MHHSWSHFFYLSSSHIMHPPWLPFPEQLTTFFSLFQLFFSSPVSLTQKGLHLIHTLIHSHTHKHTPLLCRCSNVTLGQDRWPDLFQTAPSSPVCVEARATLQRPQELQEETRCFFLADSLFTQCPFKIKQFNY